MNSTGKDMTISNHGQPVVEGLLTPSIICLVTFPKLHLFERLPILRAVVAVGEEVSDLTLKPGVATQYNPLSDGIKFSFFSSLEKSTLLSLGTAVVALP